MSVEQIIYTSCKRGIRGTASGFQILSYSPQLEAWLARDNELGGMLSYQPPRTEGLPHLPTPEEARALYPRRYFYAPLRGPDSLLGMSLSRYIGPDYPEGSQRPGNFFSHGLVMEQSGLAHYPCQYIGSQSYVDWLPPELVHSEATPEFLAPLAGIAPNPAITPAALAHFLGGEDRIDCLRQMLACLLHSVDERFGQLCRLIIRDGEEGFAMWVTALQMALPQSLARQISFSTYEADPEAAAVRVVRAQEALPPLEEREALPDYYFDIPAGEWDPTVFGEPGDFYEFAAESLAYSIENLAAYHRLLAECGYAEVDTGLLRAFDMCSLETDASAFFDFDGARIQNCLLFSGRYAPKPRHRALVLNALVCFESTQADAATLDALLAALEQTVAQQPELRPEISAFFLEKTLEALLDPAAESARAERLALAGSRLDEKAEAGFWGRLARRLTPEDTEQLMAQNPPRWKLDLALRLVQTRLGQQDGQNTLTRPGEAGHALLTAVAAQCRGADAPAACALLAYLLESFKAEPQALTDGYTVLHRAVQGVPALEQGLDDAFFSRLNQCDTRQLAGVLEWLYQRDMQRSIVNYLRFNVQRMSPTECIAYVTGLVPSLPQAFVAQHGPALFESCQRLVETGAALDDHIALLALADRMGCVPEERVFAVEQEIVRQLPVYGLSRRETDIARMLMQRPCSPVYPKAPRLLLAVCWAELQSMGAQAKKLFSLDGTLKKSLSALRGMGMYDVHALRGDEATEYLRAVAQPLAAVIEKTGTPALQTELFLLDREQEGLLVGLVLQHSVENAAKTGKSYDFLFRLLIEDIALFTDLAGRAAKLFAHYDLSLQGMDKCFQKNRDAYFEAYRQATRAPKGEEFEEWWERVKEQTAHIQAQNRKPKGRGLFGKNK